MAPKVSVKNAGGKIWHPPNRNPQRARLYSEMADFKAQPLRNDRSFFLWIVVVCQCIFLEECFCLIKSHFFIPPVFFCPAAFWRHVCLLNVQKLFFRHVISIGFDVNFCLTVFEILHLSVCNQMFCGFWSFARIFWGPFLGREEEEEPLNMAWSIFGTWFLDLIGPRENPVLVWPWKQQKKRKALKIPGNLHRGVFKKVFSKSYCGKSSLVDPWSPPTSQPSPARQHPPPACFVPQTNLCCNAGPSWHQPQPTICIAGISPSYRCCLLWVDGFRYDWFHAVEVHGDFWHGFPGGPQERYYFPPLVWCRVISLQSSHADQFWCQNAPLRRTTGLLGRGGWVWTMPLTVWKYWFTFWGLQEIVQKRNERQIKKDKSEGCKFFFPCWGRLYHRWGGKLLIGWEFFIPLGLGFGMGVGTLALKGLAESSRKTPFSSEIWLGMTQLGPKTCVPACVRHGFFKEASATCRIFLSFYLRVFVTKLNVGFFL